ncbi:MAG: undecaprenyl-diphosphate phosphatase [Lachnospiraceae bacterium]|nr:undecaprenyl-diphosphate phosphatase [Lachnospiraceae bacterium]
MILALKALLLGLIQGLTEFFPVSSSGHLVLAGSLLGLQLPDELLFGIFLHIGTLLAVVVVFYQDLARMVVALAAMVRDLFYNACLYLTAAGRDEVPVYRRILTTNYRRLAGMMALSCLPTGALGFLLEGAAQKSSGTLLIPGMCFFINGVILLVVDKVATQNLPPKELPMSRALFIGVAQGLAVMPGLSRSGVTICASLLCGMNRRMAIRYSFLLSVPTMVGALIFELGVGYHADQMTLSAVGLGVLGALTAGAAAYVTIRRMLEIVRRKQLYRFAVYCFVIGVVAIAGHFVLYRG